MTQDWLSRMKRHCLSELARRGSVEIPSGWRSAQVYDALVQDGTARRLQGKNAMLARFESTQEGLKLLDEMGGPASLQDTLKG